MYKFFQSSYVKIPLISTKSKIIGFVSILVLPVLVIKLQDGENQCTFSPSKFMSNLNSVPGLGISGIQIKNCWYLLSSFLSLYSLELVD